MAEHENYTYWGEIQADTTVVRADSFIPAWEVAPVNPNYEGVYEVTFEYEIDKDNPAPIAEPLSPTSPNWTADIQFAAKKLTITLKDGVTPAFHGFLFGVNKA